MRQLYALIFTIPFVCSLAAQTLETAPVGGNPVLRSYAAKQALEKTDAVERMIGSLPPDAGNERDAPACPPEFDGFLVESGSEIIIEIDTFDLANDTFTPTFSVINPLQFGTVTFDGIDLHYAATDGLTGKGVETIWVEYSQPSDKDTLQFEITVKRKGKTISASSKIVAAGSVTEYCLDNEPDFPAPKYCSEFLAKDADYDGVWQQNYYFTSYAYPDSCMVYWATRFPGTDVVKMRICDELAVCDTFEIPFIITGDTLSIGAQPFFDDFSSYRTPYPSQNLWLDNDVFVNTTLAKDPPSVGFATFDGLNHRGDERGLLSGASDKLTSKAIDLSGMNAGSNVSLRFFLAPKGYGLEPEVNDTLIVEFRNDQREWVQITTIYGTGDVELDSFPPFVFYGFPVDQPEFFHDAFQFRFTNHISQGIVSSGDLWHLDYIYFDKNEDAANDVFEDIAFTRLPSNLLKSHTSMPWRHFEDFVAEEINEEFSASFFNNNDGPLNFANSGVKYRETTTGTDFGVTYTLNETGTNFMAKSFEDREGTIPGQPFATMKNVLQNLPSADFRNVETVFAFANSSQAFLYKSNDTVRIETPFSDYFAHDDGTAEWQLSINFAVGGEQIVSRFHANVADTMRAVQFMFPHVNGDIQSQTFNLQIWTEDPAQDNAPLYEQELLKPFYPNNVFDTLQGFTTYRLEDFDENETPVFIPAGDFWVGFQQGIPAQFGIPVGFDIQNDCDCTISKVNGAWNIFNKAGSMMIRPVFSQTAPNNTSNGTSEGLELEGLVGIFPNPTTGLLHFSFKKGIAEDYSVLVFNQLGQIVQTNDAAAVMDLSDLPAGAYWLRVTNKKSAERYYEKIILE